MRSTGMKLMKTFSASLRSSQTTFSKPAFNLVSYRNYAAAGLTKPLIQERVIELFTEFDKVNQTKLTPEAHLTKDLQLDSLDHVEVIMAVEEEFQIEIPDFASEEIKTVKDVIDYISLREDAV